MKNGSHTKAIMSNFLSLLKILCAPILVSALTQAIPLVVQGLHWYDESQHSVLSNGDIARAGFVSQAVITLMLTLVIGMPFFRLGVRKGWPGYTTWLAGWGLVHAPVALLNLAGRFFLNASYAGDEPWLPLWSLIISVVVVSSLWWWLFYTGQSAPDAPPG